MVRRVFEQLVSAFCDVVGITKPSGRIVLMTNRESIFDAKPGAEGRRFKFVLEWKSPASAVALSRCAYTRAYLSKVKNVLYCPAYQQGIRYRAFSRVRDSHIWVSAWHAYLASFSSKTLSSWALRNLVKRSPINMIVASCNHCSSTVSPTLLRRSASQACCSSPPRTMDASTYSSGCSDSTWISTPREFYGVARLLFFSPDVALEENGELSSAMPYYMSFFVLPAILGNRTDWVRASTTELFKRQWPQLIRTITRGSSDAECRLAVSYQTTPYAVDYPCHGRATFDTQMRALSGRQPFGPEWHRSRDFAVAAILATQWGSVDVLEWMYNDVWRDRMFGYAAEREEQERSAFYSNRINEGKFELRDSHRRATQLALIVCALNGGQFKTGNVRNDKPYQKLGACARWGLSKWRTLRKRATSATCAECSSTATARKRRPTAFARTEVRAFYFSIRSFRMNLPSCPCLESFDSGWASTRQQTAAHAGGKMPSFTPCFPLATRIAFAGLPRRRRDQAGSWRPIRTARTTSA